MAEQTKRQQLEVHLANKARMDPDFREKLLADPKRTIEAEIGMRFPEGLQVTVWEEKINHLHVVLPIDLLTAEDMGLGKTARDSRGGLFWKAPK